SCREFERNNRKLSNSNLDNQQ
ncbi:unnamed protein product, partial [Allacma fusca]